jgi:hypothetical protein
MADDPSSEAFSRRTSKPPFSSTKIITKDDFKQIFFKGITVFSYFLNKWPRDEGERIDPVSSSGRVGSGSAQIGFGPCRVGAWLIYFSNLALSLASIIKCSSRKTGPNSCRIPQKIRALTSPKLEISTGQIELGVKFSLKKRNRSIKKLDKLDALWTSWNGIRMACKASAIFSYKDRLQLAQCDPMAIRIKSQHTASGLIEIFLQFSADERHQNI